MILRSLPNLLCVLRMLLVYPTALGIWHPLAQRWDVPRAPGSAALLMTAAATVYPALRASRVAPAEALRYE